MACRTLFVDDAVQCPCNTDGIAGHVPDFVGSDYYCESLLLNCMCVNIVLLQFLLFLAIYITMIKYI